MPPLNGRHFGIVLLPPPFSVCRYEQGSSGARSLYKWLLVRSRAPLTTEILTTTAERESLGDSLFPVEEEKDNTQGNQADKPVFA